MSNEWLALQRTGEWAGLHDDQLEAYLSQTHPVLKQALNARKEQGIGFGDLESELFKFLNEAVLSADPVVQFLRDENIDEEIIHYFETGTVPIRDAFREHSVVNYGLDEIVDFIMLLKLLKRYKELTKVDSVRPLEKLHSLVYLVNHRLSQEDASHSIEDTMGFGMLWKTGYRYTFEKRSDYTWSESLQRDLDRLFAWKILDRDIIDTPKPEWDLTYQVSLGEAAELFLNRFETRLDTFDSVLLKEWKRKQNSVLEDLADSSKTGVSDYLRSIDRFDVSKQDEVVLNGRPKRFESQKTINKITINA